MAHGVVRSTLVAASSGCVVAVSLLSARCVSVRNTATTATLVTADAASSDGDASGAGQPYGGTWQTLVNPPPVYPGEMALLTDGTVIVHDGSSSDWWRLTPDAFGSYVNGSWSQIASMPAGYVPTFFGLAVLANGSVVAVGGEYNRGADAWTGLGAIYDPVVDAWTPLTEPASWTANNFGIGDTPTVVLPSGVLMIASVATKDQALFDPRTLTFTMTGAGKYDDNEEEGWTLLPNGKVLTVDVQGAPRTEIYDPASGSWSQAGYTPMPVADKTSGEVGPAILMPNGLVFAMGATAHNALYDSSMGMWTAGPDFPLDVDGGQLDIADGPAALLTNGNVICATSPGAYNTPVTFFEFDGTTFTPLPGTPNAPKNTSYDFMFLPLPSGQVLTIDGSLDIEVFTPGGMRGPLVGADAHVSTIDRDAGHHERYPGHAVQRPLAGVLVWR